MMNSPARTYFRPMSADLEAGGWLSAMFMTGSQGAKVMVFENIRKGGTRLISHDLHDVAGVESVAAGLLETYPEVPRDQIECLVDRSRTLFAAVDALSFRTDITTASHCKDCRDLEPDEVQFEYFPPVAGTPLDQGSVSVVWSKCCRRGRPERVEAHGAISEAAAEVREILTIMLAAAGEKTQPQIQGALDLVGEEVHLR